MITKEEFEINMRGCDLMSKLFAEKLMKDRDAYRSMLKCFYIKKREIDRSEFEKLTNSKAPADTTTFYFNDTDWKAIDAEAARIVAEKVK